MSLTAKQRVFVEEYLRTWNATSAAKAAGYSEKTARSIGQENLTKPDIKTEIQRRLADMQMTTDEALARLAEQGRGAYAAYISSNGRVDIAGLKAAGLGHLIKGAKETQWGVTVEFHDTQAALDKILRANGAYVERREHGGEVTLIVRYGNGTDHRPD